MNEIIYNFLKYLYELHNREPLKDIKNEIINSDTFF